MYYEFHCANCHGKQGEGLEALIPPVAQADFWKNNPDALPCIIKKGISDTIQVNGMTFTTPMPGVPHLKPAEITNIINYINKAFYKDMPYTNQTEVQKALEQCK